MSYSIYNYAQALRTIATNLTKNYGKNPTIPAVHEKLASSVTITPLASYRQHLSTSNSHKFSSGFGVSLQSQHLGSGGRSEWKTALANRKVMANLDFTIQTLSQVDCL